MFEKLRQLHHRLAEGIDRLMHGLEARVKGAKPIHRLDVIVEGLRDAILGGSDRQAKQAPYLRDAMGMQRYMIMPILICLPLLLFSIYLYGWRALVIVLVTYAAGVFAELVFVVVRRHEITEGVLVTCMLFALSLPPTIPLWMVAVGIVFGVIVGKEFFGGSGHNVFNPAIVGRGFLLITFPPQMTLEWFKPLSFGGDASWLGGFLHYMPFNDPATAINDAVTTATPLLLIKPTSGAIETPLWDLFWGVHAGSLGESSMLLLLLGGALLLATKIIDWRLTVVMLGTMFVSGEVLHMLFPAKFAATGLMQVMMGGAVYAAILNITDPVTSPMTLRGKWLFAIGVGLLTVLIRGLTGYNEGVTFAILLGNMFAPLIDRFTVPKSFAGEAKSS